MCWSCGHRMRRAGTMDEPSLQMQSPVTAEGRPRRHSALYGELARQALGLHLCRSFWQRKTEHLCGDALLRAGSAHPAGAARSGGSWRGCAYPGAAHQRCPFGGLGGQRGPCPPAGCRDPDLRMPAQDAARQGGHRGWSAGDAGHRQPRLPQPVAELRAEAGQPGPGSLRPSAGSVRG